MDRQAGLARKGHRWSLAGLILALVGALLLFQPNLLLPLVLSLAGPDTLFGGSNGTIETLSFLFGYSLIATALLSLAIGLVWRRFGQSLFLDLPLLRFLANTGPKGDLRRHLRSPKAQAVDQAKVLSKNIVRSWYDRDGDAPEFIITSTDISAGRECLFTLVRPETYNLLLRASGWRSSSTPTRAKRLNTSDNPGHCSPDQKFYCRRWWRLQRCQAHSRRKGSASTRVVLARWPNITSLMAE